VGPGEKADRSPLTKWLQDRDRAQDIHDNFFKRYEKLAKVPYDAPTTKATGGLVSGMRPATHRLQSLGHDPVLGFLVGVADLMHSTGTYIDNAGQLVQVATEATPIDLSFPGFDGAEESTKDVEVRALKVLKDNRKTFKVPTGARSVLVMSCTGTGRSVDWRGGCPHRPRTDGGLRRRLLRRARRNPTLS
jgi:hypothetical protein